MKRKPLIGIGIIIVVLLFAVLWKCGAFLPGWIRWQDKTLYDKTGGYQITLEGKKVSVIYFDGGAGSDGGNRQGRGDVIWTTPQGVKVQDALSGDIDNDGQEELVLLCWRIGRYGIHKPFWVEQDEKKWSQHLFVYEYCSADDGTREIRPKWMSSYIGFDVADMADAGKEAQNNCLFLTDTGGIVNCFVWESWGFVRKETEVSFAVFGDNLIHEPIYRYGFLHGGSFDFLYENIREIVSKSDVAVINQETPFVDDPSEYSGYPRFGTPLCVGEAIAGAGFDVVTCATNHALDQGMDGIDLTKRFFDDAGILCLGIQRQEESEYKPYEILTRNGVRIALLNYTYGTNGIKMPEENPYAVHLLEEEQQVRADIAMAREEADCVVVFAHWGTENDGQADDFQKDWAQVFLESKADVVVGTHPHALQPFEVLEGEDGHKMLVYYSIGNFVSAQPEKISCKGGVAEFTVSLAADGCLVTDYTLTPLKICWLEGGGYTVK